jgi:hypothetical protein
LGPLLRGMVCKMNAAVIESGNRWGANYTETHRGAEIHRA